jgi:hypothetical protein
VIVRIGVGVQFAGKIQSGGFDTMPTSEAPKKVLDVAVNACKLISAGRNP